MSREELVRVSDADREHAVVRLRDASVEGRLTLEELAERVDRVYGAQTRGELAKLGDDLPAAPAATRKSPVRWTIVLIGEAKRRGRWRVAERTRVLLGIGECVLDLREAELTSAEIAVTVLHGIGETTIIVPEHVEVELSGLVLIGSKSERGSTAPSPPGAPLVRIRVLGLVGEVKVVRR